MLKNSNDGLIKSWSPLKIWQPFYKGGKAQYSKDGKVFVCEYDGNIKIVNSSDPCNTQNLIEDPSQYEAITMFTLHPNGSEIVVATEKFSLLHWNIESKSCLKTIKAHRMPILCMDYDPTGTLVATGSADKSIRVWDILKGYCTHNFQYHTDIVRSLLFHHDPSRLQLFSTSDDNSINVYDLHDQACTAQFKEHVSVPTQVTLSDDGYLLASCGRDRVLNFYELRTSTHIKTVPVMEELESVVFLPPAQSEILLKALDVIPAAPSSSAATKAGVKGKKGDKAKSEEVVPIKPSLSQVLVTAGSKGILRFYHIQMNGKDVSTFQCLSLWQLPLSPLYDHPSLSEDIMTLKAIHSLLWHEQTEEIVAITNDFNICGYTITQILEFGKQQLEKTEKSNSFGLLSSTSSATVPSPIVTPNSLLIGSHGDILDMITIPSSSGSNKMAVVTNSPQLRLLTTDTMQCEVLEGHSDIILGVDVSADGNWLVTSSKDKTCRVWHLPTAHCVAIGEGHTEPVGAITMCHHVGSYSARKVHLFTGAGDKILKRWHLPLTTLASNTPSSLYKLTASESVRAHDKDINCVALSPTDQLLASASQDKTIRLWNADDLSPVKTLTGHKRGIWKVLFSSIEKTLVSCSGDRTVRIWSLVDYTTIRTLEGHTASVLNAKYVNSGTQLLTCSADGLIRCWTIRSGDCEVILDSHEDRVWALEVHDAGVDRKLHTKLLPGQEEEEETSEDDADKVEDAEEAVVDNQNNDVKGERYFFSAGSDGRIIQWQDTTETIAEEKLKLQEDQLVLEQSLSNQLRQKQYLPALKTALSLQNESKLLSIFQSILSDVMHPLLIDEKTLFGDDYDNYDHSPVTIESFSESSTTSSTVKHRITIVEKHKRLLRHYLQAFTESEIQLVIQYVKEWNTLSQFSYLSQLLLDGLFATQGVKTLLSWQMMKESVEGYQAYSERHYTRLHRLSQSCHFLDYVTTNITGVFPITLSTASIAARRQRELLAVDEKDDGVTSQEEEEVKDNGEELASSWVEDRIPTKETAVEEIVDIVETKVKDSKQMKKRKMDEVEEVVTKKGGRRKKE